jgi:hypothetical protein
MRTPLGTIVCRLNFLLLGFAGLALTPVDAGAISGPLLQSPADMLVLPGTVARQTLIASDPDGDVLQFTKLFGPDWMSLGPTFQQGTIGKTTMGFLPDVADIETVDAGVEVTDGTGLSAQGFFQVSTVVPTRLPSGSISFETPHIDGNSRTMDPYIDPQTGVVFRGATSSAEVGLVKNIVTSACVPGDPEDQKLGAADLGSDAIGISAMGVRADFGTPLLPPSTVSVEFQTGAGAVVEIRLYDESGNQVGVATGTAGPPLQPCFPGRVSPAVLRLTATSQQAVSYAVMRDSQGSFVLVFDDFEYSSFAPAVTIELDLDPNVINLASHAPWVTAIIEPSGAHPEDIDPSSLRLAGSVPPAPKFSTIGDSDGDGRGDLIVKFPRVDLDPLLTPGLHELTLTGSLITGEPIEGVDEIRVIEPPTNLSATVAPNPLNPSGVLTFTTTEPGQAKILLFDVRGALVRTLMDTSSLAAGKHDVRFDAVTDEGRDLPTGMYFYRIESAGGSAGGRIAIVK